MTEETVACQAAFMPLLHTMYTTSMKVQQEKRQDIA